MRSTRSATAASGPRAPTAMKRNCTTRWVLRRTKDCSVSSLSAHRKTRGKQRHVRHAANTCANGCRRSPLKIEASTWRKHCVTAYPSRATRAALRRGLLRSGRRDSLDRVHSGASMNFRSQYSSRPELVDDHVTDSTDAPDRTVLSAVRTWLRPACETVRGGVHWRDILIGVGLRQDGIEHFDLLMRSLMHVSYRPLDMRCRCASDLGK